MDTISFEELPKAMLMVYNKLSTFEQLLLSKERVNTQGDSLLTIQQTAEFLTLSIPTIYSLVSKRQLPVNKRGKRLYFSKDELLEWVRAGRKKTITEIQDEAKTFIHNRKGK